MLVMYAPNVDLQAPILTTSLVALAQKTQQSDLTIGVCHLSENPYDATSAVNTMSPALALKNYYSRVGQKAFEDFRITIDRLPTHGKLEDIGKGNYAYYPHDGFRGNDRATLNGSVGRESREDGILFPRNAINSPRL